MATLPAQGIRALCSSYIGCPDGCGLISPWYEKTIVNGMSFGVTAAGYDIRIAEDCVLWPGDFVLAHSMEHFNIPNNLRGVVHNKSSWARLGLMQPQTVLEPGWHGYLTLELKNDNSPFVWSEEGFRWVKEKPIPIRLKAGDPIAQIVFETLTEPTDTPYTGKYQNQPNRVVEAIRE